MTSTTYLAHLFLPTAVYWKLGKTWTIAHHIIILLVINVPVCTHRLLHVLLVRLHLRTVLTPLYPDLFTHTTLQFTTNFILRSWKLLLWWSPISATFRTTWLITVLETRLEMLTICISFIKLRISLLSITFIFLILGIFYATLLHLAIITIFIFIVSFFEFVFSSLLHVSNTVFVKKGFDFACGFCVVRYCSVSLCSVQLL